MAYATQEILLILSLGGLAYLYLTPYLGAAVVVLLAVFVLSYRQVVFAYPSGGGSYDVANRNPRKVITIYIPEYVGHWWENLLHNQSALRLEGRLLYTPGVMVTSIPWLLDSAQRIRDPAPLPAPGDIRRGALPAKSSPPDIRK
ncbi:hypothetical protein CBI38_28870 [Rhodococcus oxybenzonivorans]|uniref:Uncharacterized protein n=1 Tax=Rhodococcus oxybenzonivorans TaxID=1990687 RepID=A0A2S2C260_9NOCA|nr:hypothetical protein CBI38_28870 [Rhodococcus oxybenzonivorans]